MRSTLIKFKVYIVLAFPLVFFTSIMIASYLSISYFITSIPVIVVYGILIYVYHDATYEQ